MSEFNEAEARAEMNNQVDDEFKEALAEDADEGVKGEFRVTPEELALLRAELATEFPDDHAFLSDDYILSVASKPYSKDPTKRRPLEYSQEKLGHVLKWRQEEGALEMFELIKMANGSPTATEAVQNPETFTKAKALAVSLNNNSLYWHGFTKEGRPIMWVRTNRKPWYPDAEADLNALMLLADAGIQAMPPGITDFVVVSENSYPPPPHPTFMINLLKGLVRGYPDRLYMLFSAPVSSIIQFVMNLLLPLMPGRLANKVVLMGTDTMKKKLAEVLLKGEEDVPNFFGGPANHDTYYPEEASCPNRGEGNLKFDFFGMVDRLEAAKNEYIEWKKHQQQEQS